MNPAQYLFRRRDFRGRTDKYSVRRPSPFSGGIWEIEQAILGIYPYDVTGSAIADSYRDMIIERLHRYREGWRAYQGLHWWGASPIDEAGEKKTVFNFCKAVADKGVDWLEAQGWSVSAAEGNEDLGRLLNLIWRQNNRARLSQRATQFGAVTGDSYYYVTARTQDMYGNPLPKAKWSSRIQTLNPAHVYPIWSDNTEHKMRACLIQFVMPPVQGYDMPVLFTIFITPQYFETWLNSESQGQYPNPLGEVNVVHVPNFEESVSNYGQSDLEQIIPVNYEYNTIANSIRRIIKYHAEPTTIVYGMRASQLEKGANKVWSGLPIDAKVENLQLQGDLKAMFEHLSNLKTLICELSNTPQIAFDSFEARVSNSSTSALELMFQPLVEKTRRRQAYHEVGVAEINRLVMLVEEKILGVDLSAMIDNEEEKYKTEVDYTSPLPRDEATDLDLGVKRVAAGIWSQAEFIRRLSGVKNQSRLIIELLADKRRMLAEAYEKQRALLGERPNSLCEFIGSETLGEDIQDLENQCKTIEGIAKKSNI